MTDETGPDLLTASLRAFVLARLGHVLGEYSSALAARYAATHPEAPADLEARLTVLVGEMHREDLLHAAAPDEQGRFVAALPRHRRGQPCPCGRSQQDGQPALRPIHTAEVFHG